MTHYPYLFEVSSARGIVKYPKEFTPAISAMAVHHGTRVGRVILKTFILYQLLLIVKNKRTKRTAFNSENSSLLRSIGCSIFMLGILMTIQPLYDQYFFEGNLFLTPILEETSYGYRIGRFIGENLLGIFLSNYTLAGLFALILSYVFQEGITLKEEADLTI